MRSWPILLPLVLACSCGARTGFLDEDPARGMDADIPLDAGPEAGLDAGRDAGPDATFDAGCIPIPEACEATEICGNGANDDCDDAVDEGCPCEGGTVQSCFLGAPGRRDIGACQDGEQVCTAAGSWGPCEGGVLPNADTCTGRDDLCDGCSDERICEIDCPSPGDPRVAVGEPFAPYRLEGRAFYAGPVGAWEWRIQGGPCDDLAPRLTSYELEGARSEVATLTPRLSGDYRVTLRVTTPAGDVLECSWVVHVAGPGLRVEMCYPESETQDLDLFLHRPNDRTGWYPGRMSNANQPVARASCGWHNCEAEVRMAGATRADWGYPDTPLSRCVNGPQGDRWRAIGSCANPRLDIDNNLSEGIGVPENINVDNPRDGQSFRIMVQNFTGFVARPVVNIYCGGRRISTFGLPPDEVPDYSGPAGGGSIGAMWRVADVTVDVDPATGETIGCTVEPLHPAGSTTGYRVTVEDPRF